MHADASAYPRLLDRIAAASARAGRPVRLLAVSKAKPAAAVRALAAAGQQAFGENYLQEAAGKMQALAGLGLEWHFIGRLQSNKCGEVAQRFDWVQSLDHARRVPLLAAGRTGLPQLPVLLQVNIDGESGKSGCRPDELAALAEAVAAEPALRLRGLMCIPAPATPALRRRAFASTRQLFEQLARHHDVDTLSMGMSEDFELAIEEGATLVRIGTALFGPR